MNRTFTGLVCKSLNFIPLRNTDTHTCRHPLSINTPKISAVCQEVSRKHQLWAFCMVRVFVAPCSRTAFPLPSPQESLISPSSTNHTPSPGILLSQVSLHSEFVQLIVSAFNCPWRSLSLWISAQLRCLIKMWLHFNPSLLHISSTAQPVTHRTN